MDEKSWDERWDERELMEKGVSDRRYLDAYFMGRVLKARSVPVLDQQLIAYVTLGPGPSIVDCLMIYARKRALLQAPATRRLFTDAPAPVDTAKEGDTHG